MDVIKELQLPQLVSVILGVLVPVIVQPLKNFLDTRVKRFIGSLFLSALVGGISYLILNPSVGDAVDSIVYVFSFSQIAYKTFWEQLWKSQAAKK